MKKRLSLSYYSKAEVILGKRDEEIWELCSTCVGTGEQLILQTGPRCVMNVAAIIKASAWSSTES